MTTPLYLSRVRLRSTRGEALSAIAPLLIPDDASKRAGHAHRILWLLFQDIADSQRDFLWRGLSAPDRDAITVPFQADADGLRARFPIVVAA